MQATFCMPISMRMQHAAHAHAHIERERDRARPEPGLAAACSEGAGAHVHSMRAYACTLFFMTWGIVADIHAACHATCTHIVLAWDRSRPRSGMAAACRPARMHAACIFLHALFSACHVTSLRMSMLHGMQKKSDAGAQDQISGPVRATCLRRVLTWSDAI